MGRLGRWLGFIGEASIEPRSAERGWVVFKRLQLIFETASIEPRSAERGWTSPYFCVVLVVAASIEPRSAERGWTVRFRPGVDETALQ